MHADVESKLEPILRRIYPQTKKPAANEPKFTTAGYATVLKANHHASSSSVDTYFLATLQPLIFVVSSGVKVRPHDHPTAATLYRVAKAKKWDIKSKPAKTVDNTINDIFFTEVGDVVGGKKFTVDITPGKIIGTTVVRPVDETIAAVQAAAALGTDLQVQVYGVGESSDLSGSSTTVRKLEPRNAPKPRSTDLIRGGR